jgi:predicted Zn-dependent peptidase
MSGAAHDRLRHRRAAESRPFARRITAAVTHAALCLAALPAVSFTLAGNAAAQSDSAAKKTVPNDAVALDPSTLRVERHVLPNGLTVLLHEDRSIPAVTLWQWYKVGSRNEHPGITGVSHYFEHMMFNGSAKVPPKEYDRILESNGGYSNAFTDRDMTAYYEDISSDRLDVLLELDSDRMAALSLLPEQLKSEIGVVKEERRLSVDNSIPGLLDEQLYSVAFDASPYQWPVIGWMGDLERMQRQDLVDYFRTYYAPNNCILVLTGDFDSRQALEKIQAHFGPIPAQAPPAPPVNSEAEQRGERRAEVHYPAQNVSFVIGYKAPSASSPDAPVLDVLASILSDGESSRLHRSLVYEQQIALSVSASFSERIDPGLFEFYIELKPGQASQAGEKSLDDVLEKMRREGPSDRELQKAKNQLAAGFIRGLKTNNGVGQQLGYHEHVFGDYREIFHKLDKYRSVTSADCQRAAKQYFDNAKRTVVTLVPEETAR